MGGAGGVTQIAVPGSKAVAIETKVGVSPRANIAHGTLAIASWIKCMAGSVRAVLTACVGILVATVAGETPAFAQTAPQTPDTATAPTDLTPTYFTLGDTPEPVTLANPPAAPTILSDADDRDDDAADAPPAVQSASNEDEHCLAVAVYYEARGEPLGGQVAVAQVIVNRARSGRFASTLCGVIRQPRQFSFIGRSFNPPANADWRKAAAVAAAVLSGGSSGPVSRAMYFHASYVAPGWNRERLATIGHHVFYR